MNWLDKFIVSERGQWDHPGKPTAVPTKDGRITMQGVPYPLFAMDETGYGGMIYPGGNYQFRGNMVYEIPMAYGGDISIPDLSRPNWLDKAQKGQQVKYYGDYGQYLKAKKAETDSMADYLRDKERYMSSRNYTASDPFPYDEIVSIVDLNENVFGYRTSGYSPKPKQHPVYKEKPKEYIPTKTVKLEREPIQLVMPQSDRTLMPYNNTMQVLRSVQKDDRSNENLYPARVVPAPDFKHGGRLEKYQGDKQPSQVAANLPGYNPEIGPTVKNAQLLQELKMQEAARNSQSMQLPSGAITPTMGPAEYALMPSLAAPVIKAAMEPKVPVDAELEAIRKILRKNVTHPKQTGPLTETPPWPNRFLDLGDDAWVIGNMERGRVSVPDPNVGLPGRLPKPTPKRLPGVNGTLYPDRLPKQKDGGWLDTYQDGGISRDRLKERLLNKYPGMQSVYGTEGENLNIIKDKGFIPKDYGYGDIEFINPGTGLISYTDDYQYQSPTPDMYTVVYNPRGANRKDIALDMLHGMRDDENYMKLLEPFAQAVKDARGNDMQYFYNEDLMKGFAEDGQDSWNENYIDGLLRAELAGYMARGRKDYKTERQGASPEMIARGKDIYNYVRGKREKGGAIATDNQDYNYIKYKDLSLSKGTGWLDNYK